MTKLGTTSKRFRITPSRLILSTCALALAAVTGCGGGGSDAPVAAVSQAAVPTPDPAWGPCNPAPEGLLRTLQSGVFSGNVQGSIDSSVTLLTYTFPGSTAPSGLLLQGWSPDGPVKVMRVARFGTGFSCSLGVPVNAGVAMNGSYLYGATVPTGASLYAYVTWDSANTTLSGSVRTTSGLEDVLRFVGSVPAGTNFDAKATPRLTDLAGDWTLDWADAPAGALRANGEGRLEGNYRGCPFSGTAQPAGDGWNRHTVRLSLESCDTTYGIRTVDGLVVAMPNATGGPRLLLWAEGSNGFDGLSIVAFGRR